MAKVCEISRRLIVKVKRSDLLSALRKNCCTNTEFVAYSNNNGQFVKIGNDIIPATVMYCTIKMNDPEHGILHFGKAISINSDDIDELAKIADEDVVIEGTKFDVFVFLSRVEAIQL